MSAPKQLLDEAREVARGAYAPYSGIRVGAVAVATDGSRYSGANVENAAYPSTLCAEAVAIGHAVSSGVRELEAVAVACLDLEECYPCGQCRQRMNEFGVRTVIVQGPYGEPRVYTLEELLPHGFRISGS